MDVTSFVTGAVITQFAGLPGSIGILMTYNGLKFNNTPLIVGGAITTLAWLGLVAYGSAMNEKYKNKSAFKVPESYINAIRNINERLQSIENNQENREDKD